MFKLRQLVVACVAASVVVPLFAFAVTPRAFAVDAAPTYPGAASCTAAAKHRTRTEGPECTVIVECPADSAGCALTASMAIESKKTVGSAQGRLRLTDQVTGDSADFTCSSPAARPGKDAGCSTTAGPIFVTAGSIWAATCTWIGRTVSLNPWVGCEAQMQPLGEG